MVSALTRKSITDLSRRRSRTIFAVATLALAVASIGIFALPSLMNRAMKAEVRNGKLADLTVYVNPLPLDRAELARLGSLPNVRAVEPRSDYGTQVYVGARRAPAVLYGVRSFGAQHVNVVHIVSGTAPAANQVLSERQNANQGLLSVGAGDTIQVIAESGLTVPLQVSGVGRNLPGGKQATDDSKIVLYATPQTVALLTGVPGYDTLHFRLDDTSRGAVATTTQAIRRSLEGVPGFNGFTWLPDVRAPGDWPGKHDFNAFTKFFYVVTVLALFSALVLIANTMTTLIAEQTREIGAMKAIGGRPKQIALVYVKTALLLGAVGTIVGVVLGIVISNVLVRFLGSTFFAIDVGLGVDPTIIAASVLTGLLAPPLAALPAIRRAVRVPLREALEATGLVRRKPGRRRCRAAPRALPAANDADRASQRGPASASQRRDRRDGRPGGREPARLHGPRCRSVEHDTRRMARPRRGRQGQRRRRNARGAGGPRDARRGHRRADVGDRDEARGQGRLHLGGSLLDDVPRPNRSWAVVHSRGGAEQGSCRADRAQPRAGDRHPRRRPRPGRHQQRPTRAARDRDRREPAGERNGVLRAARDNACVLRVIARERRRLLGAHDVAHAFVRRPDDDADRGRDGHCRVRHLDRDRVRRRGEQRCLDSL